MAQLERVGRGDIGGRRGLALSGEDIEHHVPADRAARQRLGASRFDGLQPIGHYSGQDTDHLPVAVTMRGEAAAHPLDAGWKLPALERRTIPQCPGLARQHRHIMPGVINGLVPPKPADMLSDDLAVLPDDEALGIGVDFDRAPACLRVDRVFVIIEADEQGPRNRRRQRMESIERPSIGDERRAVGLLEYLPDGSVLELWMRGATGMCNAPVQQPGVELVVALFILS